jgi:hypothetical protein
LGARLDAGHEPHAATWCYICAGNVEKAVDIWARTLKVRKGSVDFVDLLQARFICSFDDFPIKSILASQLWGSLKCVAGSVSIVVLNENQTCYAIVFIAGCHGEISGPWAGKWY